MENNKKLSIEEILGKQVLEILHTNNIYNLQIETDGTLSGSTQTVRGLPVTDYLQDIKIVIKNDKIIISAKVIESNVDVGKII